MSIREDQKSDALYVNMLGGFHMIYKGEQLSTGAKGRDSQVTRLLEAVIHSGAKGVKRDQLRDILFEDREIDDASHGLRTIIYNTKKKLEKDGLPPAAYIVNNGGRYYWTQEIPVVIDAWEFEKLYNEAELEKDPDIRQRLYLEAIDSYKGEFLPMQTHMIWVAQEERHYSEIYTKCVENVAALLRMNKDFNQLEALGKRAAAIQPLMEWESLTMEALIALGRDEEARRLYEKTEKYYMDELGFKPTFSSLKLLEKLGNQIEHQHALLDEIQAAIANEQARRLFLYM